MVVFKDHYDVAYADHFRNKNFPDKTQHYLNNSSLMSESEEQEDKITFTTAHLNKCLASLASCVMTRERQNYESYSMYYENLLRVHHQLLYQKEQEVMQ